ncbi:hypothetical protein ACFOGJ_25505 [Marinibaculum pumilum]|uniref:DUF4345 domain-containing protein n=1 Tax=Marinibaculum pumilum TaxID=1766165 RepID=A0ABV7L7Z1_9PROT
MRLLALILALYHGANGALMLALPGPWYRLTPGAAESGPMNAHFVRDIGLGFLAAALALALFARAPRAAIVWPAALFLGGHAGLHLAEMALHGTVPAAVLRDLALIVLPGLAPLWLLARPAAGLAEGRS